MATEHTSLYRKYRPQNFNDVVGQDHIVKVLESSIKDGKIAHAYLFAGSRGTGKTSIARIMASALGVTNKDFYEIDAASNNKVEDIRDLREGVSILPFDSKYKIYILDDVHMLSKGAFNALLKTLEEPPAHVIFILATTELDKVPETIISRCQTFSFKKPNELLLAGVVRDVVKKEGFTIPEDSIDLIAVLGEGSFRDTLGVLQKVLSSSKNKKISSEEIESITGAPSSTLVNDFLSALSEKNIALGVSVLNTLNERNIDPRLYLNLVLIKLRYALLLRYAPEMRSNISERISAVDLEFLEDLVSRKPDTITSRTLEVLLDTYQNLRNPVIPSLPIEIALIDICNR